MVFKFLSLTGQRIVERFLAVLTSGERMAQLILKLLKSLPMHFSFPADLRPEPFMGKITLCVREPRKLTQFLNLFSLIKNES